MWHYMYQMVYILHINRNITSVDKQSLGLCLLGDSIEIFLLGIIIAMTM